MSAPIGPGDWVECVDVAVRARNTPQQICDLTKLRLGGLYRIRGVAMRGGLLLDGIRTYVEAYGLGWDSSRFRPIYRPKSTFIESLKQPAPEREPERA